MRLIVILLTLSSIVHMNCNENDERSVSTSIVGMVELLQTERMLIQALESYISEVQKKIDIVRSAAAQMRLENEKSGKNPEQYLANPLNSFALIRRMQLDWINWELFLSKAVGKDAIEIIQKQRINMPSSLDLNEAASAIFRLHTTYDLKPADMAAGILNGKQYDTKLSSLDCFAIGYELFKENHFYYAGFWLYEALQFHEDSEVYDALDFTTGNILEIYGEILLNQGRLQDSLIVIEESLKFYPQDARLLRNKQYIELAVKTGKTHPQKPPQSQPILDELSCRAALSTPISKLHCRYNTTTSAFLKLAPLKMEEIYMDPYIVVYHDVISEREIEDLKQLSRHQLKRAHVFNPANGKRFVIDDRTCKTASFLDNTTSTTIRLHQRIVDMTRFNLNGSDLMQTMNYGLGGHYAAHYDFFNISADSDMPGDRISTVLFYLSDVEDGGATVFPYIKTAVLPRKGSAVMWYNLNNKGEGDWRTLHAACPVIVGSKWVCSKWIREKNQIFARPCYEE